MEKVKLPKIKLEYCKRKNCGKLIRTVNGKFDFHYNRKSEGCRLGNPTSLPVLAILAGKMEAWKLDRKWKRLELQSDSTGRTIDTRIG